MRGRKGTVWAVVILAALITAGLILSCGDDDGGNGEPAATCEDICEKLVNDCEVFPPTVEGCTEWCEDEVDAVEGDVSELLDCTVDTSCEYIGLDCYCKALWERLVECEFYDEEDLIITVPNCGISFADSSEEERFDYLHYAIYYLGTPCDDIEL